MVTFKSVSLSYGLCFPDREVLVLSLLVTMGAVVLIQCQVEMMEKPREKTINDFSLISNW